MSNFQVFMSVFLCSQQLSMTGFGKALSCNTENSAVTEHDHFTFVSAVEEVTQSTLEKENF